MVKMLEVAGLALVGVMILSFVGALRPTIDAGTSAVFWGCAVGALAIILYRRFVKKRRETSQREF